MQILSLGLVVGLVGGASPPCSSVRLTTKGATGICGSPAASCNPPTSGLCGAVGSPSSVTTNATTFSWTCSGQAANPSGGVCVAGDSITCYSNRLFTKGNPGICGTPAASCTLPTTNLCTSTYGNSSPIVNPSNANAFSWTCSGQPADPAGGICTAGDNTPCGSTRLILIGECGTAHTGNYPSTPSPSSDLCAINNTASSVGVGATTYTWTCDRNCNSTDANCWATRDIAPTFPVPTPTPSPDPTDATPKPGGGVRLHNCQFPDSNQVTIEVTVNDANGLSDIGNVFLRFNGIGTTYEKTTMTSGVATFNMNITSLPLGTYTVQAKADDVHSPITSGWVTLDYEFKKWDCQVDVDGMFYDGSVEYPFTCDVGNTLGFATEAPVGLPFDLRYSWGAIVKTMTNASPEFRGWDVTNTLDWRGSYSPLLFNFPGVIRAAKIGDSNPNCVTWNSPISVKTYVNAWDTDPRIDIKYSAVMDQEAWYRVKDGTLIATDVTNYVPPTCEVDCKTTVNGLVWADTNHLSFYDESDDYLETPKPDNLVNNNYARLKREILETMEVGVTYGTGQVTLASDIGVTGIIFINGDLMIDTIINPPGYVFYIVSGDIGITNTVNTVRGLFVADGEIRTLGDSDTKLTIYGTIYSKSGIELTRSYVTKVLNNENPAVEVIYDPNLIFKLPVKAWRTLRNWRLE